MKKVCVVGHFGFGKELLNGQTIKTKIVATELEKQLGRTQIMKIDTHGGVRVLPKVLLQILGAFFKYKNIIILPAHNGIRFFVPICSLLNKIFRRKLHYVVIGGWIDDFLKSHKIIESQLKHFSAIYVETTTMKRKMEQRKFLNIYVMPNFKDITILSKEIMKYSCGEPYRLCTFSRVMKEKGIEEAVEAIKNINTERGHIVCKLDIYGQIDSEQNQWFDELRESFPDYVYYRGQVPFNQSVQVLKDYYALLFPTRFYTEGIPGTIIDAYAAGVPIISSKWESFDDLIEDGVDGFGYDFSMKNGLEKTIKKAIDNEQLFLSFKSNCLDKALLYKPEVVIKCLIDKINS